MNNKLSLSDGQIISLRSKVLSHDIKSVEELVKSTGFFTSEEVEIARELVRERLEKGIKSGYYFLFAYQAERLLGYTCYGPISGTQSSYDLYWIAVHHQLRGKGIGKELMKKTEQIIKKKGGTLIYIDTSSSIQYFPTRSFYLRCGYQEEAVLKDFYRKGENKIIYVKNLEQD